MKTNQAYRRLISPTQTAYNLITANMSSSTIDQDPSSQEAAAAAAAAETIREEPAAPALPPLTDHEFKQYNRLAEHMDYFVSLSLSVSHCTFIFFIFVIHRLKIRNPPPLFFFFFLFLLRKVLICCWGFHMRSTPGGALEGKRGKDKK